MRVLITGHRGFIGRHFWAHLGAQRHELVGVDIAALSPADCRNAFRDGITAVNNQRFDLVIHCAAVVGGRTMIDGQPLLLATEDLSIDAALFGWALRHRPHRIVYFSSSAAYPVWMQSANVRKPLTESDTLGAQGIVGMPDATYGWVKLTGERLAAEANAEGIRTHVFRPFSGYGGDQALDYPFPAFVARALRREQPFDVWGPGDSARDWVHVDDVVGAVMAAIDADRGGPLNICTGRATTFDDLAQMCMAEAGYSTPIRHLDDAPRGVHWRVGDPTRMQEVYMPRITLEEGIARAMRTR